jgi:hypothetical protein
MRDRNVTGVSEGRKVHYRTFIKTPRKFGLDYAVACESVMVPYLKDKQAGNASSNDDTPLCQLAVEGAWLRPLRSLG